MTIPSSAQSAQSRPRQRRQLPPFQSLPDEAFIRQPQVLDVGGFGASTLWRQVSAGTFPKPVRLTQRAVGWRVGDVRAWLESRHGR